MENVISLQAIRHLISPQHRRNQYDWLASHLLSTGINLEAMRSYMERERMQDGHMKAQLIHALDVIADAYNYAKKECELAKKAC